MWADFSIAALLFFTIAAQSKSVYIGIVGLVLLAGLLYSRERKLDWKFVMVLPLLSMPIMTVAWISVQNNFIADAYESITFLDTGGSVGSGSTFIHL